MQRDRSTPAHEVDGCAVQLLGSAIGLRFYRAGANGLGPLFAFGKKLALN
jgi:hypothetical protein